MPKVSVIIPAYNCEKYIAATIDSVLAQTFPDLELVVIDDGSTDGTKDVVQQYDARVRYFYQKNQGVSAARNRGIAESKGDYIAFLDNDDIWFPDKLELQVPIMEADPDVAMVFTDGEKFNDVGVVEPTFKVPLEQARLKGGVLLNRITQMKTNDGSVIRDNFYHDLFLKSFVFNSSVLIRKSCLDQVGIIDASLLINSDYDLWIRMALKYPLVYLNRVTARWRVRADSLSGEMNIRNANYDRWDGLLFEKHLKLCPKDYVGLARKRAFECYRDAAVDFFQYGDMKEARRLCVKSLTYNRNQPILYVYFLASFVPRENIRFMRELKSRTRHILTGRGVDAKAGDKPGTN